MFSSFLQSASNAVKSVSEKAVQAGESAMSSLQAPTEADYSELPEAKIATEKKYTDFLKLCTEMDGWGIVVDDPVKNIKVHSKQNEASPVCLGRITAVLDTPPDVVWDVLHDDEFRREWDKLMIDGFAIETLDKCNSVRYYSIRLGTGVANRDFVNVRSWTKTKGRWIICNHSVKHPAMPLKEGYVRGVTHLTGYLLEEAEGGRTKFTYLTQTDPKGWIPGFAVNFLLSQTAPKVIDTLQEHCPRYRAWKAEQSKNPDIRDWLDIDPDRLSISLE